MLARQVASSSSVVRPPVRPLQLCRLSDQGPPRFVDDAGRSNAHNAPRQQNQNALRAGETAERPLLGAGLGRCPLLDGVYAVALRAVRRREAGAFAFAPVLGLGSLVAFAI